MYKEKCSNPKTEGVMGRVSHSFSVISVISCMGDMGIELLLGTVGGILAILWKTEEAKQA